MINELLEQVKASEVILEQHRQKADSAMNAGIEAEARAAKSDSVTLVLKTKLFESRGRIEDLQNKLKNMPDDSVASWIKSRY
jgi:hypothetical protein